MDTVKNYLILSMTMLIVVLGIATGYYQKQASQAKLTLSIQSDLIKEQNRQSQELLTTRTKERDTLQAKIDAAARNQENIDEAGKAQIASDTRRDAESPVRVRYVTRACGSSGGSAPGQGSPAAADRAGDAGAASGVLAPPAAELFKRDQDAVEKLQLAYNSCRARVVKP